MKKKIIWLFFMFLLIESLYSCSKADDLLSKMEKTQNKVFETNENYKNAKKVGDSTKMECFYEEMINDYSNFFNLVDKINELDFGDFSEQQILKFMYISQKWYEFDTPLYIKSDIFKFRNIPMLSSQLLFIEKEGFPQCITSSQKKSDKLYLWMNPDDFIKEGIEYLSDNVNIEEIFEKYNQYEFIYTNVEVAGHTADMHITFIDNMFTKAYYSLIKNGFNDKKLSISEAKILYNYYLDELNNLYNKPYDIIEKSNGQYIENKWNFNNMEISLNFILSDYGYHSLFINYEYIKEKIKNNFGL